MRPSSHLAVVACMDCRLDVTAVLNLEPGQAHVIRNAGGVITDDVIRSLCLSQRELGTRRITLIHHTDCGLQGIDEAGYLDRLADDVGERPPWRLLAFTDAAEDVLASAQMLRDSPFVPHTDEISTYVYDVDSLDLVEIPPH